MTRSVGFVLSVVAVSAMVVMVKFSPQLTTDITLSQVPSISSLLSSWLRPPYLYLVINGIIVTIFASSKLHQRHDQSAPSKHITTENNYEGEYESKLADLMQPQSLTEIECVEVSDELYGNGNYTHITTENNYEGEDQSKLADLMQPQSFAEIECVEVSDESYGNGNYSVPTTNSTVLANNLQLDASNMANISYFDDGTSANFETLKLPRSASFVHPRVVQANTEGEKESGGPKPEQKLETLDSTWKAITEGRSMPITHQHTGGGNLQNSHEMITLDSTWKAITEGRPMPITHQHTGGGNLQNSHEMITSEAFNQQLGSNRNNVSRTLAGSSILGKLKRDPSPGQEELNKRVEAFISRFKEDMRLQRKESLRQHVEMINSGAY